MSLLDLPSQYSDLPTADPDIAEAQAQQRRIAAQQTGIQQQQAKAALEIANEQHINRVNQQQALGQTMASDVAQWAHTPEYAGQDFQHISPEYAQHLYSAYPAIANQIPGAVNEAARAETGNPKLGLDQLPTNSAARVKMNGADVSLMAPPRIPADIIGEASRLGVPTTGRPVEDVAADLDDARMKAGIIPEKYMPQANRLASEIQRNPVLSSFAKQKSAYDTLQSGFQNKDAGGFGDMAMIEGFQRIVNPGAVVRQGTMNNMQSAVGWLSKLDPSFQWKHAIEGDKLTGEARNRLMKIADDEFGKASRQAGREMAGKRMLARSMGIADPKFVDNVLSFVGGSEPEQQPQTQAAPQAITPQVGEVRNGYQFRGGNPADQNSWQQVK